MMADKEVRSQYELIFPEDSQQYREIAKRYMKQTTEDYKGAYDIMQDSWALAQRWSDIQSNVSKLAVDKGVSKSELRDWCYQRYRQLQLMHESARMIWGMGEREARELKIMGKAG
jgi:hypothetical protein